MGQPYENLLLWVAETSSRNEVVDSVVFVPKLISHFRDPLGAPALPVVLAPSQTRTRVGEFSPPAPDRRAPLGGAQAQTAGQRPVVLDGPEKMVAKQLRFLRLFQEHGFNPQAQVPVTPADGTPPISIADFAVPNHNLAIYVD